MLTEDELRLLLKDIDDIGLENGLAFRILLATCVRSIELAKARWEHVDVKRSRRESPFGAPVAHGFLTMSLLSQFLNDAVEFGGTKMGVNYGFNRLRFTAPVKVGSRLRGRFCIKDLRRIEGGVQIIWDVTVECEGQPKPALVAEWVTCRYG